MKKSRNYYALNRTKFLNDAEVEHFESICRRNLGSESTRDALLMLLALHTGARAEELLNVCKNDFSATDQTVYIRGIKGSNDREIPIPHWLADWVVRYIKTMPTDAHLFPISYGRLRQIWIVWRPVPKVFHSLRHTFAIRTYLRTKDIRLLQVALGHRSILNTMIYADYCYSTSEMRRILG